MNAGDTVLSPSPGGHGSYHLYVIASTPDGAGNCAFVNVTSQDPNDDHSCILDPADHPFIKHKCVVRYGDAFIADASLLDQAISTGVMKRLVPVKPDVLERIQHGALASKYTENGVKDAIRIELGI